MQSSRLNKWLALGPSLCYHVDMSDAFINVGGTVLCSAIVFFIIKYQIKTAKKDIAEASDLKIAGVKEAVSLFTNTASLQITQLVKGQETLVTSINDIKVTMASTYIPRVEFHNFRTEIRDDLKTIHSRLDDINKIKG